MSSSVVFLIMSVTSQNLRPFNAEVRSEEYGGCSSAVTLFFTKKSLWLKPTGVLEHCREGETNCLVLLFSGHFLLIASLRRRRMSMYFSLFTAAIPINYVSEFRELFEATAYTHRLGSLRIAYSCANDKRNNLYGNWIRSILPLHTSYEKDVDISTYSEQQQYESTQNTAL
jgi:hypothetical protein